MKWSQYLSDRKYFIFLFLLIISSMLGIQALDPIHLKMESLEYMLFLSISLLVIYLMIDFAVKRNYYSKLQNSFRTNTANMVLNLPNPLSNEQLIHQQIMERLYADTNEKMAANELNNQHHHDFMNAWVHEIKTPISSAKLTIQNDCNNPDMNTLQSIDEELEKIEDHVQKVLFYVRMQDFANDYLLDDVSIEEVIKESVKKNSKLFIHKRISVAFEDLGFLVVTDRKWIGFVIDQLLSNALKYTPNGGSVTIRGETIQRGSLVHIEDNGIGIPAEDLPRLFDRSFTGMVGRSTANSTGMGLYLSKMLVEKLNHSLSITSEWGKGTCATIFFPQLTDELHVTQM